MTLPKEKLLEHIQNMRMKVVIKESHASPVQDLVINRTDKDSRNIFATVGGNQATVYDDAHFGDHIGVVVQYTNEATEYTEGGELRACAWVSAEGVTPHPHGDALLAVAGKDKCISIISVVETRVTALLKGHEKEIIDLASCAARPGQVISLSRDGTLRLWDIAEERCLQVYESPGCTALAWCPDGASFLSASKGGRLLKWDLPEVAAVEVAGGKRKRQVPDEGPTAFVPEVDGATAVASGGGTVECMMYLPSGQLVTRDSNGTQHVWDPSTWEKEQSWKIPNCGSNKATGRCRFGSSACGSFIAAGNHSGEVFVYDTYTGKKVATFKPERVSGEVRSCALSDDCRHLLAVYGNGFVFRYEFRGEPATGVAGAGGADAGGGAD